MSMEHWWNGNWRERTEILGEKPGPLPLVDNIAYKSLFVLVSFAGGKRWKAFLHVLHVVIF